MKSGMTKQPNSPLGGLKTLSEEKKAGLAFSASAVLPYVFSFLFAVVGFACGLFYEGYEAEDWYIYAGYLLSQAGFAVVIAGYFLCGKTSLKTVMGKPKVSDFILALALQFGLLSVSVVNEWFCIFLQRIGLSVSVPQTPSLEGGGFYACLFVVAVLPAVFEETLFRGILLRGLKGLPVWAAALICGGMFSLFHQNPVQTLYPFFCGTVFALLALRSGSILPTIVAHFLNNAFIICTEKFAWQTYMLPILLASLLCFVAVMGYLVFWLIKHGGGKKQEEVGAQKGGDKQFFTFSAVGFFICLIGWISRLVG